MATIVNKGLAGHTSSSRWGDLVFDKHGHCEVDDEVGEAIANQKLKGFEVLGLASAAADEGDIDDEELTEEDLAGVDMSGGEGEGEAKSAKKLGRKKSRR